MKIIRIIFWFLVLVCFAGLFLPQDYQVNRSIEINASSDSIHQLTNDLKQWPVWNPWLELEPSIKVTLGETTKGVGANQYWSDNSGGGRLEFIASAPRTGIIYNLWFNDAKLPSVSHLNYIAIGNNKTRVEWKIEGEIQIPIVGFYIAQMMDSNIGSAFELGLTNLKREAEQ
ncbi:MAG: SRPBCC family protein [Gammaproteobacteria bacterium]|nr:SRPBCC family protein [Gammaproteobacteria bacterium]